MKRYSFYNDVIRKGAAVMLLTVLLHCSIYGQDFYDEYLSSSELDSVWKKSENGQKVAALYSFIGNNIKAIHWYSHSRKVKIGREDIINRIKGAENYFKPMDDFYDILSDEKIVIFNEAHHLPRHRVFLTGLLPKLKKMGYNYIGFEGLTPNYQDTTRTMMDTLLRDRGYPIVSGYSGYYIKEPQFGNLIRSAIQSGFRIFGYEKGPSGIPRERKQAQNIARVLAQDPDARIVIFCGYDHLIEKDTIKLNDQYPDFTYMAGYLKKMTDIDPLTVNQVILSDYLLPGYNIYYDHLEFKEEMFVSSKDLYGIDSLKYDYLVYHPRTKYNNGRPDWVKQQGYKYVDITDRLDRERLPCVVRAVKLDEKINAVPMDIIEVQKDAMSQGILVLPIGKYNVYLRYDDNSKDHFEIHVK